MLHSQRIALRISEVRAKLNEHAAGEGVLSDDDQAELDQLKNEYRSCEQRLQAALIAEAEQAAEAEQHFAAGDTPEARELRSLADSASVVNIAAAVAAGRSPNGAEAELQQELSLMSNEIPLLLLEQRDADPGDAEQRANDLAATYAAAQRPTRPVIFPSSVQAFAMISRERVPSGQVNYPIITAPTDSPNAVAAAGEVTDTDWHIDTEALSPERVQRSFIWQREQQALFGSLEADLRRTLSDNMADALDQHALRDTGQGLFDFGTDPTAASDTITYATAKALAYTGMDGRYAPMLTDVRLLTDKAVVEKFGGLYRSDSGDSEVSIHDWWNQRTGGMRFTAHAPAAASNVSEGVLIRGVGSPHVVQPIWGGVQLIRDEYSKSQTGEIRLTALVLCAVKVVRTASVTRVSIKTA